MSRGRQRWGLAAGATATAMLMASSVLAGDFDFAGNYQRASDAVAFVDFTGFDPAVDRYFLDDVSDECAKKAGFELVEEPQALSGTAVGGIEVDIQHGCAERILVPLPAVKGSYRATFWARHATTIGRFVVLYPEESGLETSGARMAPTGRTTSDGWVELASNDFPVDGTLATATYLHVYDYDSRGAQIDAIEVVPSGEFEEQRSCDGVFDSVCNAGSICLHQRCRIGRLAVPPLPHEKIRDDMIDVLQSTLRVHFGGRKTRLLDLPEALSLMEKMRFATDPWVFWNLYGEAIRALSDSHTRLSGAIDQVARQRRLNLCFIAGQADTSAKAWPSDPKYPDILVSHTGSNGAQGLARGDRLVAVDGMHPVAWALQLRSVNWGWRRANDDGVFSEFIEDLRGLVVAYAKTFSYIACDGKTQTCDDSIKTVRVVDLPKEEGGRVRCDNRPVYHYDKGNNPNANHSVGSKFFKGRVVEAPIEDEVYGLTWDTLYGGGDPNGYVNKNLTDAFAFFKAKARGVILDHRSGNGGTLDAAETATFLVKPPEQVLVFLSPLNIGGDNGPANAAEGLALFNQNKGSNSMVAGSNDWDPDMPVALLTHRDVSASDFFPFAFKGAKKGRIFGPTGTAGAFSTFYNLTFWGPLSLQLASGDAISKDGQPLIGHGVVPDVVVQHKQSDLLAGKDTIHEVALAWVRANLKPKP